MNICLLTVEDTFPEDIYTQIASELRAWLFVRKGIVHLQDPFRTEHRWVTNLADWRRVMVEIVPENDLVFCTVDLKIPEHATGEPDSKHGLTIANEIQMRHEDGLRCCILTGLSGSEIENLSVPNVLFDFKGDSDQGYPSIVSYIKSQALSLVRTIQFPGPGQLPRTILLDEQSGRLRDHYISKASYYVDEETWHVPTLLVGNRGLGRRVFLEFVAYIAGAEFVHVDLGANTAKGNRENFNRLETLRAELEGAVPREAPKRLLYVAGLDEYQQGINAEPDKNCLWPLRSILKFLRTLGPKQEPSFPLAVAFGVSGASRLRIQSKETRSFIRFLEECVGELSDFPLQHLAVDQNGWPREHPRILWLPSLQERGTDFLKNIIDARLESLGESLAARLPGYKGQTLELAADVRDLMADKTDWASQRNLADLIGDLDAAFENFVNDRAAGQFTITRAHLSEEAQRRFERTVLSMDDVRLELPDSHGGRLLIVDRADCQVFEGELLVILGPSGGGKSTVLRMFAGLQMPTSGTVSYRGQPVTGPSGKTGFIFQDYSLFPWLTVRRNIEFGPNIRGVKAATNWAKVEQLLEVAKLTGFEDTYPSKLSGGMRQRVAIVRSIANDSDVLLMDEPFSALDVQTRWEMQDFLVQTKKATHKTIVFVTHDLDEAVYLADRIYICSPRPLTFEQEVIVPFSANDRKTSLRRDPVFLTLVNRVHQGLLDATTRQQGHGRTHSQS
ncbi:MAG TPA: ABC transporter ATP-binding protein [Thermoanaerobaculia bacterium]|nr:ABC transporter ATP-binding protein [Thermoanaerobaculia bacterium]